MSGELVGRKIASPNYRGLLDREARLMRTDPKTIAIACVGTRAARNAPTNAPSVVVLAYLGGIRKCIRIVGRVPLFAVKALEIFLNQ